MGSRQPSVILSGGGFSRPLKPTLRALSVACGSNTLMYDGEFLLFKETVSISMQDTFKTWELLDLFDSLAGLAMAWP